MDAATLEKPVTRNGTHPLSIPIEPASYNVLLSFPGPSFSYSAVVGILNASKRHSAAVSNIGSGWDSFNQVWCQALNEAEQGKITHFAMLHSDIKVDDFWLDTIIDEMDRLDAGLISVPVALKDQSGVTSCGLGQLETSWGCFRRFTVKELNLLPETFNAEEIGYPDLPLIHNNGCWVADLRKPQFFETEDDGRLKAFFHFPREVIRNEQSGLWTPRCQSEDWYFSRELHDMGLRTFITRKVKTAHIGIIGYPNYGNFGTQEHDEATRQFWDPETSVNANALLNGIGPKRRHGPG